MSADPRLSTCVLCPRLCRSACPVATGTGREAAVPAVIASVLREWGEGRLPDAVAAEAAALCVDCGACEAHCHLGRPLPALLAEARAKLRSSYPSRQPETLREIEGQAERVVVCTDDRPFAPALTRALACDVATWRTGDRLGAATGFPLDSSHLDRVRAIAGNRSLVVADGGVAEVLTAAGVPFTWLHTLVPGIGGDSGSCRADGQRPMACCGGAGPLAAVSAADAARVGRAWATRRDGVSGCDTRCRDHLLGAGVEAVDAIDALLARVHP